MEEPAQIFDVQSTQPDAVLEMQIRRLTEPGYFNDQVSVDLVTLSTNSHYRTHIHSRSSTLLYVISGRGIVLYEGERIAVTAGQGLYVAAGKAHGFEVGEEPLEILSIQSPPILDRHTGLEDIELLANE